MTADAYLPEVPVSIVRPSIISNALLKVKAKTRSGHSVARREAGSRFSGFRRREPVRLNCGISAI